MPGLASGMITLIRVCHDDAPASVAASIRERSIRIIELKIGTTMKNVNRCTKAKMTANSENNSHSSGSWIAPIDIKP